MGNGLNNVLKTIFMHDSLKRPLVLILMMTGIAGAQNAAAQSAEVIHLWGNVPGETGPKAPHELSDNTSRNVKRIARVTDPVLHVYSPAPEKNRGAGVIVCPGGGYQILAIDLEGHEVAKWLSNLGFTAFVLEYRVPGKPDNALQDLQRAVRVVKSRAKDFGIQDQMVGAIGFSAGGSLVARASSRYEETLYSPQDAADSLSAKLGFSMLIYPAYMDKGETDRKSKRLNSSH